MNPSFAGVRRCTSLRVPERRFRMFLFPRIVKLLVSVRIPRRYTKNWLQIQFHRTRTSYHKPHHLFVSNSVPAQYGDNVSARHRLRGWIRMKLPVPWMSKSLWSWGSCSWIETGRYLWFCILECKRMVFRSCEAGACTTLWCCVFCIPRS